jgi:hypothetical protein
MLNFTLTRAARTFERPISNGYAVTAEGQALVAKRAGGQYGVIPSAGVANEEFAGISLSRQTAILYFPAVEEVVVAAGQTSFSLTYAPVAGTIILQNMSTGASLVVTTNFTVAGNVVTEAGATVFAGATIRAFYKYAPTVVQAKAIQGDVYPGGPPHELVGSVGVITHGDVFTSEYNTSVDWSVANPDIKLGANGLFTIGGGGVSLANRVQVLALPSPEMPYLGLTLV